MRKPIILLSLLFCYLICLLILNSIPRASAMQYVGKPPFRKPGETRPATRTTIHMTIDAETGKVTYTTGPTTPTPVDPNQLRKPNQTLTGHTDTIRAIALSPKGDQLLSGGDDRTVRLWDLATGKELRRFAGHGGFVRAVGFAPNSARIITCSDDASVRIWDAKTGEQLFQLDGHQGALINASFLSDGKRAVSAGKDGTVRFWDVEKESLIQKLPTSSPVCAMAISPAHDRLAVGTHKGNLHLIDLKNLRELHVIKAAEECLYSVAISPDGTKVITGGIDSPIRIWNIQTAEMIAKISDSEASSSQRFVFSPDGNILAVGIGLELYFYDLKTGHLLKTSIHPISFIQAALFTSDGQTLITAGGGFVTTNDMWTEPHGNLLQVWKLPQPLR